MVIFRQKDFSRYEPNYDFVKRLEEISIQANRKFPQQGGVGIEVIWDKDINSHVRAEIFFGWDDQDSVHIILGKNGKLADGFNLFGMTVNDVRHQLLTEIDKLLRERIPGTKEKLEFLKAQIILQQ